MTEPGSRSKTSDKRFLRRRRSAYNATILASRRWGGSGGETFVTVMQATDLRDGDDSSDRGWHDQARVRAVLLERKMGTGPLVIVAIRGTERDADGVR
jgi:hypothetical protein